MQPPSGQTCGAYLQPYASAAGGSIYNSGATSNCEYCSLSSTNQYLAGSNISYDTRWRDYGIGFAYIIFNVFMAVVLYYLFRVRKGSGKGIKDRLAPLLGFFRKDPKAKPEKTEDKMKTPQGQSAVPA